MTSTFPLLQLPDRAIKTVLKHYRVSELILFSTISNRAKSLVKSGKRNAYRINIDIATGCMVYLYSWASITIGESKQRESDILSSAPCAIRVTEGRPPSEISLTLPGFNVRKWLVHFMSIFNCPEVDLSFGIRDEWIYSLESVIKVVEGIPIGKLEVSHNCCKIVKHFPHSRALELNRSNLEPQLLEADLNFLKKVLIGNFHLLRIYGRIPVDLNMLLLLNSPDVIIGRSVITVKELNKFLKVWLKGASPNLRRVKINFVEQWRNGLILDHNVVMKGIANEGFKNEEMLGCKYIIRKLDGT